MGYSAHTPDHGAHCELHIFVVMYYTPELSGPLWMHGDGTGDETLSVKLARLRLLPLIHTQLLGHVILFNFFGFWTISRYAHMFPLALHSRITPGGAGEGPGSNPCKPYGRHALCPLFLLFLSPGSYYF